MDKLGWDDFPSKGHLQNLLSEAEARAEKDCYCTTCWIRLEKEVKSLRSYIALLADHCNLEDWEESYEQFKGDS